MKKRLIVSAIVLGLVLFSFTVLVFAGELDVIPGWKGWDGHPDTLKVYIDSTWTEAQKDSARTAMERWNDANGIPHLEETTDSSSADITISEDSSLTAAGLAGLNTWTEDASGHVTGATITVAPGRGGLGLAEVITHELGHSLGLDDVDSTNRTDVMKGEGPSNGSDGELSDHDKSELTAAMLAELIDITAEFSMMQAIDPRLAMVHTLGFHTPGYLPDEIVVEPVADPYITVVGAYAEDGIVWVNIDVASEHWSGEAYLDIILISGGESYEFLGQFYVNSDPVLPTEFSCWFEYYTEGGVTFIDWVGNNDYPYEGPLSAELVIDGYLHMKSRGCGSFPLRLTPGTHTVELYVEDFQGNSSYYSQDIEFLNVESEITLPKTVALTAYPNPFNSLLHIKIEPYPTVGVASTVQIFGLNGRKVAELKVHNGDAVWDGKDMGGNELPSGVYFYDVRWECGKAGGKVILLR